MDKLLCISADSHVVEPPEVYEPLAARFGDAAPRVVFSEGRGHEFISGATKRQVAISGRAGINPASPYWEDCLAKGYAIRPALSDVQARVQDQDLDGVDGEILYPSLTSTIFGRQAENLDLVKATFSSYNDWIANHASEAPRRLFPLALIQLTDLDAAVAEMTRAKKLGHVGCAIPCAAPTDRPYADPVYDQFWAAAQELDMPLAFHTGAYAAPRGGMPAYFGERDISWPLFSAIAAVTISDLILYGVCDRFPSIKFIPTEFETGWIATFLLRMDWNEYRAHNYHGLEMKPSDYWRRNFYATFEDDEVGVRTRDILGTHTLMWASDYPHGDATWPDSQATLDEVTRDCTPEEKLMLRGRNAVEVYNLPFEL